MGARDARTDADATSNRIDKEAVGLSGRMCQKMMNWPEAESQLVLDDREDHFGCMAWDHILQKLHYVARFLHYNNQIMANQIMAKLPALAVFVEGDRPDVTLASG
jgi:hypothetical protein